MRRKEEKKTNKNENDNKISIECSLEILFRALKPISMHPSHDLSIFQN